jgi:glyoxylase-like metal-dependent hydrolase (beta-lactamase superfamily II)
LLKHSFSQITPHIWWLSPNSETDRPTLGTIVGSHGTLLVDTGNSPTHARHLIQEIEHRGIGLPTFVLLTHWHWDHIFGASEFQATTLASCETKRIVSEMAGWEWSDSALDARVAQGIEIAFCRDNIIKELPEPRQLTLRPPDIGFTDLIELNLGDITCEIIHVGGDHAPDSSIVYVPQDKIVFLGDCLYLDIYATPNRYTTAKLFPLIEALLALDADIYFEGHNPNPTTRAELVELTNLLRAIGEAVHSPNQDRLATFDALKARGDLRLVDEDIEYVDAFIAGLRDSSQ